MPEHKVNVILYHNTNFAVFYNSYSIEMKLKLRLKIEMSENKNSKTLATFSLFLFLYISCDLDLGVQTSSGSNLWENLDTKPSYLKNMRSGEDQNTRIRN